MAYQRLCFLPRLGRLLAELLAYRGDACLYPGAKPQLMAACADGLIDGCDVRKERFIFRGFSLLAVKCLPLIDESVNLISDGLLQCGEVLPCVNLVLC